MIASALATQARPPTMLATDGEIAAINLRSVVGQAWGRFWQAPGRPGIAESIVEMELLNAQYLGDLGAYLRLEKMARHLAHVGTQSARTSLLEAQVACSTHRFADARLSLARAIEQGAPSDATHRLALSIDQACGTSLDAVLDARRRLVARRGGLEAWVPLGALLADLHEFDEADWAYRCALDAYRDVSPFAFAWVCFQLGMLWGEQAAEPEPKRAAQWYQKAIDYLPGYVKARVHLAEIRMVDEDLDEARGLLLPALESEDPEVHWRLADVLIRIGRTDEAADHLRAARDGFERLLDTHLLAFADHAAEFYSGSGNDVARAFALAKLDLANRPTMGSFERAHKAAIEAGEADDGERIRAAARQRWGASRAFRESSLAKADSIGDGAHAARS